MTYASNTKVPPGRSQEQIRHILKRNGAEKFGFEEGDDYAAIMFERKGLTVRITVDMPKLDEFRLTDNGRERSEAAALLASEKVIRQRWRALLLVISAKLEAVASGISTIETEFMPFVVMPNGKTLADMILPALPEMVRTGHLPKLLTAG